MYYIHAMHLDQARLVAKERKLNTAQWRFVGDVRDMNHATSKDTLLLGTIGAGVTFGVHGARERALERAHELGMKVESVQT